LQTYCLATDLFQKEWLYKCHLYFRLSYIFWFGFFLPSFMVDIHFLCTWTAISVKNGRPKEYEVLYYVVLSGQIFWKIQSLLGSQSQKTRIPLGKISFLEDSKVFYYCYINFAGAIQRNEKYSAFAY
jgi:hypothetical protein